MPLKIYAYDANGKLFYLDTRKGTSTVITPADSSAAFPYKFVYSSLYPSAASELGTKDFYLELNSKTDTLHYDIQLPRPNACFNRFDVAAISFNGKPVAPHSLGGTEAYYVLQRAH